jgi:hypothetical protein
MNGWKKIGSWAIPYLAAAVVLLVSAWLDQSMAYRGQVRGETLDASSYLWSGALVSFATSALIILLAMATLGSWRRSRGLLWTYVVVGAALTCFAPVAASNIPGFSELLGAPALQPIWLPLVRMGPRSVLGVTAAAVSVTGILGLLRRRWGGV